MSRILRSVGALVVLGLVGTCAIARCPGGGEVGAPLWTEDDLPALPPAADNGWVALDRAVAAGIDANAPDAAVDTIVGLDDRDYAEAWSELQAARAELDAWRRQKSVQAALAAWDEAAAAEHFADACAFGVGVQCHHFVLFQLQRAATAHALWQATRGDVSAAVEELAAIISTQRRYRDSARTLMGGAVATAGLQSSLSVAQLLLWHLDATPDNTDVSLQSLRREIEAIDESSPVARRALIGEYVMARTYMTAIAEGDEAALGDSAWAPRWVFDQQWTRDRIDASYQTSMALAVGDSAVPPRPEPPSWLDRVLHPVGAPLVALLDPTQLVDDHLESMDEDGQAIARRRQELLARMR